MSTQLLDKASFLKSIPLSLEQKKYFLSLHKFCFELNRELSLSFGCFSHSLNHVFIAGGSVRDALLLGVDKIKDIDIVFSIEDPKQVNFQFLIADLFVQAHLNPVLRNDTELLKSLNILSPEENSSALSNEESPSKLIIDNPRFKSFLNEISKPACSLEVKTFIDEKYNYQHSTLFVAIRKLLVSAFLENKFPCNSQYNVRPKNLNLEAIENDYGVNINALIGLIKSKYVINNTDYDVDFLLPKTDSYVQDNFDIHICQASFPYKPTRLYHHTPGITADFSYFYTEEYSENINFFYDQERDYLDFIEKNIDDDNLFFSYFEQYLYISKGFIFNVTHKVLSFNTSNKHEVSNSLKKHFQNIIAKYPYPLYLLKEEISKTPIFDIIEDEQLSISLW